MPEDQEGQEGQEGQAPAEPTIPASVLPEDLRGKSPDQIKAFFELQQSAAQARGEELREIREQLQDLKTRPQAPSPPPKDEPKFEEPTEDEWLADPGKAAKKLRDSMQQEMRSEMNKTAQPALAKQAELDRRTAVLAAREKYDDWSEVKDDVMKALKSEFKKMGYDEPVVNETTLDQAYRMFHGEKAIKESKAKDRSVSGEPPSAPKPESQAPELSDNEREAAKRWGMTEEEWVKWQGETEIEVKAPTAKGASR